MELTLWFQFKAWYSHNVRVLSQISGYSWLKSAKSLSNKATHGSFYRFIDCSAKFTRLCADLLQLLKVNMNLLIDGREPFVYLLFYSSSFVSNFGNLKINGLFLNDESWCCHHLYSGTIVANLLLLQAVDVNQNLVLLGSEFLSGLSKL